MVFPCGSDCKESAPMQETWVWSLDWEDPLEKGMATHSSILAWRILWTEGPVGLQSMGLQKVEHNWTTNTHWKSTWLQTVLIPLRYKQWFSFPPTEGNGNSLPYSYLENPVNRGAWQATAHGVANTTEGLTLSVFLSPRLLNSLSGKMGRVDICPKKNWGKISKLLANRLIRFLNIRYLKKYLVLPFNCS